MAKANIKEMKSYGQAGKVAEEVFAAFRTVLAFNAQTSEQTRRKEKLVLNNVSFTINAGKTVALVGSSGSGKSTCTQLLLRFYELTNGHIKINDRNIDEFDIYDYNQAIGVVSQEAVLFATSIQDNIRFGKKNATQDDVIEAAKQAHAHDFIMKLPEGYNTMVGERGVKLSGGQRQRIALARALIRQPNLLILDEATSALDSSSEKIVQQALERASKGRTTIVIAHRLSTIRHADWIVVMKDGAVIEQGSHDDLIAANHMYSDLFKNYQSGTINVESSEIVNMQESDDVSSESIRDQELDSIQMKEKEKNEITLEKETTEFMIDESSAGSFRSLINLLKLNSPEWPYLLIASLFTIAICAASPQGCLAVAGARLTNRLRIKAFGCMLRQEVGWFDETENSVGSLCSRLSTDALEIQKLTGVRLGLIIQAVSLLIIALILGAIFSWQLTLVVYGLLSIVLINVILNIRRNIQLAILIQELVSQYSDLVTQSVHNIRTVFQLNRQHETLKSFEYIIERKLAVPSILKSGVAFALSFPIITFILPSLGALAVVLLEQDLIDPQRIILLFAFIPLALDVIQIFTIVSGEFARSSASAKRLNRLFKRKPVIDNGSTEGKKIDNFSGSIEFENIIFAYPTRKSIIVLDKFHLAIKSGQSVALTLPQGYNTSVGRNGIFYLSGGQKQRIAIARALFRNPKILLLDEATSALDVHNEQLVQESLDKARQDDPSRTIIIVAHRLSTIQSCDFICVFDYDGCLLECGTHAELMALRNAYHRLFLDYVEGRDNS
ncbi:unnamed protein product [Rotaria sordida]|uniref:Uncharacterized protein n=1 Tax=Rotaria sordida TaxID=392033 RepID=A0A815YFU0_9BILA|nr:unnamed protein product [Rotaria sordida]CAF1570191.1 unnamed protein product [Rotaria sordida]